MAERQATLAGGCFWCTEAVFNDVVGVSKVESGYTGGQVTNPTYRQVCGGDTGHAEAIRVTFDPDAISYDELLDIFLAYGSIEAGLNRWTTEYRFRSRSGQYVDVLDHGFVIRNAEGTPIRAVGAMADVTARRRDEAELKRMQAELIQVSRRSAMGAMASTLAHELNQPLTAVASYVRGGLRMLDEAEMAAPPEVRAALEAAEASAIKAGQIVRSLRELVSRRSARSGTQDLMKIIEEANVLAFVDQQAQGLSHRVEVDPAARWVEADSIQIQQVLINLIRNAIQAMAESPHRLI